MSGAAESCAVLVLDCVAYGRLFLLHPFAVCETCVEFGRDFIPYLKALPPSLSVNPRPDCLEFFIHSLILRLQCDTCEYSNMLEKNKTHVFHLHFSACK